MLREHSAPICYGLTTESKRYRAILRCGSYVAVCSKVLNTHNSFRRGYVEIPSFAQQVFQDSAAIPVDERPLIGLTPRFMKERGFSDGESIAEVQMDAILAAGGIPVMMPLTDDDALY